MRGWIELRPVARQQDAPGRTLRRTRGATPSARVLPKGGTGSSVRCSCGPAEDGCRERNRSQETRKTASSAAVKGPMRSMSNRPNQTRVVRLDAFGCSTVRLSAATHPLSLVDFRDVRIMTGWFARSCSGVWATGGATEYRARAIHAPLNASSSASRFDP